VETVIGGHRHGVSFLARISEIGGLKLLRPALVETRYLQGSSGKGLLLSPGFPAQVPATLETAIGRVLPPLFETKCLNCHGALNENSPVDQGVRCEACHGGGAAHLKAVENNAPNRAILNPKKSTAGERIALCGRCHSGFGDLYDPVPRDLLISSQVSALKNSQCFIQSGGALECVSCHNPHHDAGADRERSSALCLTCHSQTAANRAALCPVNRKSGCLECHMPVEQQGSFQMVNHWIGVHPEQAVKSPGPSTELRTRVKPRKLYLRLIVAEDRQSADRAHQELSQGASFFDTAQKYSKDASALAGGFLGEMPLEQLNPRLAAAALELDRGRFSGVLEVDGKPMIVARLPRDFLYDANIISQQADKLRESGDVAAAAARYQEALKIYPRFLRALVFLGVSVGAQGDSERAIAVLNYASRLYPNDPAAQYNLGIAYGSAGKGREEIAAYRRAIELQPDLAPAYLNLGNALLAAGQAGEAAAAYRAGLNQNPLAASLYYNLSIAEEQLGKTVEARWAGELAARIDRKYAPAAKP
jgi:predicted CXXCH cytochrome family protein